MIGGGISSGGALAQIVKDEAAKLGKSGIASAFISRIDIRSKGGSYDACPPSGPCSPPYIYIRTGAGRITLPFKNGNSVVPTDYAFGDFVDGLVLDCPFKQPSQSDDEYAQICPEWKAANDAIRLLGSELFRSQIRAALKTW
jgi:hypothetical protein